MTSYIAITNAETDPDAPLTSELAKKWRDNPIAITEGETGAPRIQGAAIAYSGNGLATLTISAANTRTLLETAPAGISVVNGTTNTSSASNVSAKIWTLNRFTGTVRVKASHRATGGATSTIQLYKNGVSQTSFTTTSATDVAREFDVTFVAGDDIEWRHRCSSGIENSIISGMTLTANQAYIEQPAYRVI